MNNKTNKINTALKIDSKNPIAYLDRSYAYYDLRKYEEAFSDLCSAGDLGYPLNKEHFFKVKNLAGK